MRAFTLFILIGLLLGCNSDPMPDMERTFIIQSGDHCDKLQPILPLHARELEGSIYLDQSMVAQEGFISKIVGISGIDNHKNSARIGWVTRGDLIELVSYVYVEGHCPQSDSELRQSLGLYSPPVEVSYKISYSDHTWHFQLNENMLDVPGKMPAVRYISMPWYGGHPSAPHDIKVQVSYKFNQL